MGRLVNNKYPNIELPTSTPITKAGGGWPLKIDRVEDFCWATEVFNNDEIRAIKEIGQAWNLEKAGTYGGNSREIRNSHVSFIFPNEHTHWIFARMTDLINNMNEQYFGFDLHALEQGLQFTHYVAPDEHYTWHVDRGRQSGVRKLSVSIQLSDPEEYEGGELELSFGPEPITMQKQKGMAVLFPSYTMHRVKPVTKGERFSLVAWVSGPPFK